LLEQFERELQAVVKSVEPSVVTIRATTSAENQQGGLSPAMSVGSGLLLDTAGLILTSSRVVTGADDFWVETSDERLYQAALLGSSEDVAVLQIKGDGFTPAPFGDAADLAVGSFVAALGNSYGYSCGMSWGQVNGFRPDGTIQLALGVSPGNTGGALVNSRGRVVGLVKAKVSEPFYLDPMHTQAQFGDERVPLSVPGRRLELPTSPVSLAIPIQAALRAAQRIIESGTEPRAYVGIYVEDLAGWYVAHFKTSDGVLVTGVVDQTPAERSGIQQADVITAVDHESVGCVRQFRQIVSQATPGQRLQFDVIRGGRPLRLVVEAGRAQTPHLGETDRGFTPYASGTARPATQPEVSPPMYAATGQSLLDQLNMPSVQSGTDTSKPSWLRRIETMQHIVDSLQKELLLLQSEARR
jgi:S1-C subfamily serine protease